MQSNDYSNLSLRVSILSLFLIFISLNSSAQEKPKQDSTAQAPSTGRIHLNPNSIVNKYTYDPLTNKYIYTQKTENINVSYPMILTPEEFQERVMAEQRKETFKTKFDAVKNRHGTKDKAQNDLLPVFYANSDFFESVFGGDEIEFIPQGSVEVDLGVLFNKQDNPSLSPRNRSNFTFDFDQGINMSLNGHVGKRLGIEANYDTESTFDFQNQIKLDYTPDEDDILRKLEVGNVNMPLNSSLMQGSQSLFGVKAQFQFGKTSITGVYSEQNSERQSTQIEGGGALEEFDKFALEYDQNRHFFLSQYFRDHYNKALKNYPYINTDVEITRIQIWVTNRSNSPEHLKNTRNIVALQDIGESDPEKVGLLLDPEGNPREAPEFSSFLNAKPNAYPDNANNDFNPLGINGPEQSVLTASIRDKSTIDQGFGALSPEVDEGKDYAKLESARQLNPGEYTLHPKLGYISLNTRIRNDEILAVAYQYTVDGEVHQVGEFANDGVDATAPEEAPNNGNNQTGNEAEDPNNPESRTIASNKNLVVKMLKSTETNVKAPVWDLMMKNIYDLDVTGLDQDDFEFNIIYTDPHPQNYILPAGDQPLPYDVGDTDLLSVFNLDNLNSNQDPVAGGDGFFDYVPGITIDEQNGRLIFTTVEPFGKHLFDRLKDPEAGSAGGDYDDPGTYNENQKKYVFRTLYTTTKIQADEEDSKKNKFKLKGEYKSSGEEGIPIGSFNVPHGSVKVTAGGRELQEGVDYTVDYELGRVKIINEALKASDIPINVSTENNAEFGQQSKRFAGIHIEHKFNDNLQIGGTFLNLNEKPQTHKSNYGHEPINNSMYGVNFNYDTSAPFLTRLVNKLPNIDTDVESNLSVNGEFAYLHPGSPKGDDFGGQSTAYLDDFEGSQTKESILAPQSWYLASAPIGYGGEKSNGNLASAYKRAKLNWYSIDPIFYSNQRPSEINDDDISAYDTRRIFKDEIFPETDIREGETRAIFSLDLSYYPGERGDYNYNPETKGTNDLPHPKENFGGIMRGIESSDFEQNNVQYVEFWVMDPYIYKENANLDQGTIKLNFGDISEDILKDGHKQYENGLPKNGSIGNTLETSFGKVPSSQSMTYAFDTNGQQRDNQDLGLDGLTNAEEAKKFPDFAGLDDPANDDYEYYLHREGDIVERYKHYNGTEGNSPTKVGQKDRGNNNDPSVEDVNRDNTMNTVDSYFEYEIPIYKGMSEDNNTGDHGVDEDYITDVREENITLKNGKELPTRWVKFRMPLNTDSDYAVGGIGDLRSIRFMRMFLTGFNEHVVLRFGTLNLVRGDYRKYEQAIKPNGSDPKNTAGTSFKSESVSEENTSDYVTPPGVHREERIERNQTIREDERSLALSVKKLKPRDSRAVYKKFQVDMRQYKNLKMFLHAASLPSPSPKLGDGDLAAFIRIGTDYENNFYQIEIPLKPSDINSKDPNIVWPETNNLDLPLSVLEKIKSKVIGSHSYAINDLNLFTPDGGPVSGKNPGEIRVGIKGHPSFGDVRTIMLGVKNIGPTTASGEVWFNEFRMADMENEGGWAAILNMDTNLADFASISATAQRMTEGFGNLNQGPNQRSRENSNQYDIATNINAGQLLPDKWGLSAPLSYSRGEKLITPEYDPEFNDLKLNTLLNNAETGEERRALKHRAEDYTKRQSFSIIGLHKDLTSDRKPLPIAIENFSFSGTYNQVDHRDFEVESGLSQTINMGATYDYSFSAFSTELRPFENISALDSSAYYKPLRDLNLDPLPDNISAYGNILRQYNEKKYRQSSLSEGNVERPTLFQRDYRFDWGFTINDKITESLNFVFTTSNNRIIRNYLDDDNVQDNSVGIWDNFFNMGDPNQHNQSLQINYDLPTDKFPFLQFINARYSYTGNFQWQKGSEMLKQLQDSPDLGNSIQNSRTHQLNATMNMKRFYDYLGLEKKGRKSKKSTDRERNRLGFKHATGKSEAKRIEKVENAKKLSVGEKLMNTGINILTALNRITINYEENSGTYLPGYLQDVGFIGTLKPTTAFTFGSQADIRQLAARRGWLTRYEDFNEHYNTTQTKTLSLKANLDLLPDLTIDLDAQRTYSENYSEKFRAATESDRYRSLTSRSYGNFNISTNMISTAFQHSDENGSKAFDNFRENRLTIANRLARNAGIDLNDPDNINQETGFPKGFGRTDQDVLLPAFLSAYTGKSASGIKLGAFRDTPMPNWDIKYTGLMDLEFFKNRFRRFSLQHGYKSDYTINRFESNLNYDQNNPYGSHNKDQNGNYKNETIISNINLVEQFSPLLKVDLELKNSVKIMGELDRDRVLSLSFDNDMLTEVQGKEYRLGLGYRVKDLKVTTNLGGHQRVLSSDLNLKADISLRQDKTIIRHLDINDSQITSGQNRWEIHFTADYALSKNLSAIFYYDHRFSKYEVSTAYPQTTIRSGLKIRYTFGN